MVKAENAREKMKMVAQQEDEQTWRPRVADIEKETETCEANVAEIQKKIEDLEIEIKWSEDEHAKLKKHLKLHQESKRASKPVGAPNFILSQEINRPNGQPAGINPKNFHIENAAEKLADCVYNSEHKIDSSEFREHTRRIANEFRLAHPKHASDENIEKQVYEPAVQLQEHEHECLREKEVSHINSKNFSNGPCNKPCNAGIRKVSDDYIRFLFDPEHRLDHRGLEERITKLAEEIHNEYPERKTEDIEARLWDEAIKIREDDDSYDRIRETDRTPYRRFLRPTLASLRRGAVALEQLRSDAEDVERLARGLRAEYEEALRRL
ncbi:hypothetical protein N0V86_009034 [Didymella sp. IMI 355093]|nr:hypothetical protein N0V86_009034 [Didymella sp. IMI 355093]